MGILNALFPAKCIICGQTGSYFCPECERSNDKALDKCPECGNYSFQGKTHSSCLRKYGLSGRVSLYSYSGTIRKVIHALKYRFAYKIADDLAKACVLRLNEKKIFDNDIVLVPIPLHKNRENWRGFNQAEEVGKLIAKEMCWYFCPDILRRVKKTTTQVGLEKEEREKNVKGIFSLNHTSNIQNTRYLLFDDVWTTGATVKEACKVLKKAGAGDVWGLTIAG